MRKFIQISTVFVFVIILFTGCKEERRLIVGGYTKPGANGLSLFDFNAQSGDLKLVSDGDAGPNPSFLCYSAKNNLIYAIDEVNDFKGSAAGGLTIIKLHNETGSIEKIGEMAIPVGGPCNIAMSPDSGYLFIANYPKGSVAVVKLNKNGIPDAITDSIIYQTAAPDTSHAHMITSDPAGKRIYVSDLGLNRIMIYNFDKVSGKLKESENGIINLSKGSGPRHFTFSSDGSKMYVINELGSTIMVFNTSVSEGLKLVQTVPTIRKDFRGSNNCADIHISNDGKFLYGSNRGENSIVVFRIETDGTLTLAGHTSCGGDWPRNFALDPSGKFILVANQKSNDIAVFRIDKRTGLPLEPSKNIKSPAPVCLKFL